jgi:D-alanine--poly(phosphoribitol) ligase subunit 1
MSELTFDEEALRLHRRINRTTVVYPSKSSVKELFERCAERVPESTAVVCADRTLTYREFNGHANALAARLLDGGVRQGEVVGVCVARSPELIIALLAILKCGATYLPVDPAWPDQRLNDVFDQAGCLRLLADDATAVGGRFPCREAIPVRADELPINCPNPEVTVSPEAIAYINFTSGSTGRPKGVPIRHRSIARLLFNASYARLDENTTLLHLAPVSFDAATFEIWGALLHGGTCVLYPAGFPRLSVLKQVLRTHRVTVVFLTTALFNTVVDEAPDTLDGVSTILTGGEAHSRKHVERALARYGPDRLVSVYGPTECTTFAAFHPIRRLRPGESALPIGLPIQNTRLYLVSEGRLCGPGEVGEVWLAGPGLSPGYLGAPETTRERFVEREIDGVRERLYRTGDRGYFLDDGNVVFHGRLDDQVKVNGYRIELGEVSFRLTLCPQVRQGYVAVGESSVGGKELLAFVVPVREGCTPATVRGYLRKWLPGYMIPAEVFVCDALPLSATGKVDRLALLSAYRPYGVLPS